MTPNRAEATCLIRASWRRPSGPGAYQAGSSPPSPVFAAPPARWMPMVSAWWASGLSAPTLIAETTKRRTIDARVLDLVEGERASARSGRGARRAGRSAPRPGGRARRGSGRARRRCRRAASISTPRRGRRGPGSRRRSAARRGGPRRRRGSGRTRGRAGAARGRPPAPGWPARRSRRRIWRSARSARVVRPGHAAAVGKQRATTDGVEVDDVDQRAADVRRDRADAHPGERLAQPGLEARRRGRRPCRSGVSASAPRRAGQLGGELDGEPRMDGGRADREDHRHGVDVEDVDGADRDVRPAAQAGGGQGRVDGPGGQDRRDRAAGRPTSRRR